MSLSHTFTVISNSMARMAGSAVAFTLSVVVIICWAATGPIFHFSDTWQLIINTATTIITFLMVFLIQNTQNRDGAAIQAKLNELIRVSAASNTFIGIEYLTQEEVDEFRAKCAVKTRSRAGERTVQRARKGAKRASDDAV